MIRTDKITNDPMTGKKLFNFYRGLRKLYKSINKDEFRLLKCEVDPELISNRIFDLLVDDEPRMICRFGANEIATVFNYLGIKNHKNDLWGYLKYESGPWWWNKQILWQMEHVAGFFPITNESLYQFGELMIQDTNEVDVLGCWRHEEVCVEDLLEGAYKVLFPYLEPWFGKIPWTIALADKNVLVVHPFSELIKTQYENRQMLFDNGLLPTFKNLYTIKAVQSYGDDSGSCGFRTWFDALKWMENEMDKIDYDVCLLGCGAYGFPLAAHAKRRGKKAVHLGGTTQLIFGIYGQRWLNPNYGVEKWGLPYNFYPNMINDFWARPNKDTMPKNVGQVENACYW